MYSVFFVEDEPVLRGSIRDYFNWGAENFIYSGDAPDGEAALPLLMEQRPDIIVTDIAMPFMDGLELIRIVKKELPHTAVVIMSGHDDFILAQQAIALGVCEYILKPITPPKLLKALGSAARRLEDERDEIKVQLTLSKSKAPFAQDLTGLDFEADAVDREEIERILKTRSAADAQAFALSTVKSCSKSANASNLFLCYYALDVIVTAYKTAKSMGLDLKMTETFESIASSVVSEVEFADLLCDVFSKIICARNFTADRSKGLVQCAVEYIENNYQNGNVDLTEVAKVVRISPNYLSTLLSKEKGETFSELLNKVRIKRAMQLLKSSDAPIGEIAVGVGYNDIYYFSKTFKKLIGVSPREYKKM